MLIAPARSMHLFINDKQDWDFAALPSNNHQVYENLNARTFFIWKGSKHPLEAYQIMTQLVDAYSQELLDSYDLLPTRKTDLDKYLSNQSTLYPWVMNWNVIHDSLNFPDTPGNYAHIPNGDEVATRIQVFGDLLAQQNGLNFNDEIARLQTDLTEILNK